MDLKDLKFDNEFDFFLILGHSFTFFYHKHDKKMDIITRTIHLSVNIRKYFKVI